MYGQLKCLNKDCRKRDDSLFATRYLVISPLCSKQVIDNTKAKQFLNARK